MNANLQDGVTTLDVSRALGNDDPETCPTCGALETQACEPWCGFENK